jgi:hypothetical protein
MGIVRQPKAPAAARVAAAIHILDRGWGKAEQSHTPTEMTLQVVIRQIVDIAPQSDAAGALTIDHDDHS